MVLQLRYERVIIRIADHLNSATSDL